RGGSAPCRAGVRLEDARIDTAEFRHDWLLDLMDLLSPVCFGKTPIRGRIPAAGARAKPATPGRRALARRTLAAAAVMRHLVSRLFCRTGGAGVHRFCSAHST